MDTSHKIWGIKKTIHLDSKNEIDILYLKKNSHCSTHYHKKKINKFYLVSGKVKIHSELGETILTPNDEFVVRPPLIHRFVILEDSVMIEMAYVEKGKVSQKDIIRMSQGGKLIKGKEYTLDEMKEKGMLGL